MSPNKGPGKPHANQAQVMEYQVHGPECVLELRKDSIKLGVQAYHGIVTLFVLEDPTVEERVKLRLEVHATGHHHDPTGLTYVGTAQLGPAIWHVFERA